MAVRDNKNLVGFSGGEKPEVTSSPYPSSDSTFQKLSQGYVDEGSEFKTRGGLDYIQKVALRTTEDRPRPRVWQYTNLRCVVFQFVEEVASGGVDVYRVKYSIINTSDGTVLVDNQYLINNTSSFIASKVDLLWIRRGYETDEEIVDTQRSAYLVGGFSLTRLEFSDTGITYICSFSIIITNEKRSVRYRHPYTISRLGDFIVFYVYRTERAVDDTPYPCGGDILTDERNGTLFTLMLRENGPASHLNSAHTLLPGERIHKTVFFSELLLSVSNKGLRGISITEDTISSGVAISRMLSFFPGANVRPITVSANFLVYCGRELRMRDISGLEASVRLAGDFKVFPVQFDQDYIASGNHPDEDNALFLDDKGIINSVSIKRVNTDNGPITVKTRTTFLDNSRITPEDFHAQEQGMTLIQRRDDYIEIFKYNRSHSIDYYSDGTQEYVKHTIKLCKWAYVRNVSRLQLSVDLQGAEVKDISDGRIFYSDSGDYQIFRLDETHGSDFYSGGLEISFKVSAPIRILTCVFDYDSRSSPT